MKTLISITALFMILLTPVYAQGEELPPPPEPPQYTVNAPSDSTTTETLPSAPEETTPQEPQASEPLPPPPESNTEIPPTIPGTPQESHTSETPASSPESDEVLPPSPVTNTSATQEDQPTPPSQMTPEQARATLRQNILDNPESLALLHRAGFQLADLLEPKWQMTPLKSKRLIRVDRARQRVFAFENGIVKHIFICSTCANGIVTPVGGKGPKIHEHVGIFSVVGKEKLHYSREYDVDMPHAVRFVQGHFTHETTHLEQLGYPASSGCVRMNHHGAITIYNFVHMGDPVEER